MNYQLNFQEANMIIDETVLLSNIDWQLRQIPRAEEELMPGIKWGCSGELFTPAYWKAQYLMYNYDGEFEINYQLGNNIYEEVVACLLGGFGMKAEIGLAAFDRLMERSQIKQNVNHLEILSSLKEPFLINGNKIHYRFPNQKAKFISGFLNRDDLKFIPMDDDLTLRDWLLSINGIGPKTAAWITRNYLNSEKVAIIDIHIYRACLIMGLYTEYYDVQKDYAKLEQIFLHFCTKLSVQPSKMDALIWLQMKVSNRSVIKIINNIH